MDRLQAAILNPLRKSDEVELAAHPLGQALQVQAKRCATTIREEPTKVVRLDKPDGFGKGYVVKFTNAADKGKTLVMVCTIMRLLLYSDYKPEDVYTNFDLYVPGVHVMDNAGIRQLMVKMCREHLKHKIIAVSEIDGVYPARFFKDPEQTKQLLGLWQATKLENWLLYDCHEGTSIDKVLRDVTQFSIMPEYAQNEDLVRMHVINGVDNLPEVIMECTGVSNAFKLYRRQQPIY